MTNPLGPSVDRNLNARIDAPAVTEDQAHKAAKVIASFAADADECRELLAMLDPYGTARRTGVDANPPQVFS